MIHSDKTLLRFYADMQLGVHSASTPKSFVLIQTCQVPVVVCCNYVGNHVRLSTVFYLLEHSIDGFMYITQVSIVKKALTMTVP